jgi:hypothetical protein
LERLDCAPNKVLAELEEVRAVITRPENIRIHMAANLEALKAAAGEGCRSRIILLRVRAVIALPENIRIHMAANLDTLKAAAGV